MRNSIWTEDKWTMLKDYFIDTPIIFVVIPKINGEENVQFICKDLFDDIAKKLSKL